MPNYLSNKFALSALIVVTISGCASDPVMNAMAEGIITAALADATGSNPYALSNTQNNMKPQTIQKQVAPSYNSLPVAKNSSNPVYYRDTEDYARAYAQTKQLASMPGANYMVSDVLRELEQMGNMTLDQVNQYNSSNMASINAKSAALDKQGQFYDQLNSLDRKHQALMNDMSKTGKMKAESYTVGGIVSRDVNWNLEKSESAARNGRGQEALEWYNDAVYADKLNQITRY